MTQPKEPVTISEAIESHYRMCEKLLNDFRNNRIGYEKFIESEEDFIRQSITSLLSSIKTEEMEMWPDAETHERGIPVGYNRREREVKESISKILK